MKINCSDWLLVSTSKVSGFFLNLPYHFITSCLALREIVFVTALAKIQWS